MNIPKIYGFNRNSDAGPNCFAFSVFLYGCTMRCPFCMNHKLVVGNDKPKTVSINTIKEAVLADRPKMIVVSGGEPCLQKDIENLLGLFTELGVQVGMSTNGTMPNVLKKCLPFLDFVAIDIKSPIRSDYKKWDYMHGKFTMSLLKQSLEYLRNEVKERPEFAFEARTTLYPQSITIENVLDFVSILTRNDKWVLQPFRDNIKMLSDVLKELDWKSIGETYTEDARKIPPYNKEQIDQIFKQAKMVCPNVVIRYV